MPKNEPGTAAHAASQIRRSQKTKIRWYCGLCDVPCKDENGFKCHLESETHLIREQAVEQSLRTFKVSRNDRDFRKKFLEFLISKHFGQTVFAHEAYRELYPLDRPQNIMKSTCWETLGTFIAQLRKEGRVEAHKGVKGWQVRITSRDFSDIDQESENESQAKVISTKRKADETDTLKISFDQRMKNVGEAMAHSESTTRTSEAKVIFSLPKGPIGALSVRPSKRGLAAAFGSQDTSSDYVSDS